MPPRRRPNSSDESSTKLFTAPKPPASSRRFFFSISFLVSGDIFLRRLVEILPRFSSKRHAVDITQQIESDISAYLVTITIMNAVVGIARASSCGSRE